MACGLDEAVSIFARQHDRRHRPVPLGDDVDRPARCGVAAEQAGAVFEGVLVRLLVFGAKFLAPIAAVVTMEVFCEVNVQRKCTGCGVGFPNREAGLHQLVWHRIWE